MSINAISFRGTELEAKKLENNNVEPKVELAQEADKVELSTKKKRPVRSFWGSVGAYLATSFTFLGAQIAGFPISSRLKKANNFTDAERETLHNAVKQMHVDSGLKEKGVKIRFLNPLKETLSPLQINDEKVLADKTVKFLDKFDRNLFDFMNTNAVRRGDNAFFLHKDAKSTTLTLSEIIKISQEEGKEVLKQKIKDTQKVYIRKNSVILPQKGLESAGFHELGHALNFNMSKFGKFLQKCRPVALFAPALLAMYGVVTRASKPKEEGKELNGRQKTHNFVRNNAGKLALAASLPMLIEEGMATIKGQKFAKKLLSPELAKKVFKGNAVAYTSYLLVAGTGALAAAIAVKVKDNAIAKKEAKIAEKERRANEKNKLEQEVNDIENSENKLVLESKIGAGLNTTRS